MASTSRLTQAAYQSLPGGVLDVNKSFYDSISSTAGTAERQLLQSFILPIRSGRAWKIPAGTVCRIIAHEGPQVGDLNLFCLQNPRERLWASRTRQLQRAHVSLYDRLWSNLPYLRPLCTIVGDSLKDYGKDKEGGRCHDLLGTRCDPYINKALSGKDFDYCCHSNLTRAVAEFGLVESDVHDVLNVFQCTGLNDEDKYFMKTCPAQKDDYFEFFAEIDLLAAILELTSYSQFLALSTCPGGDLSKPMWGEGAVSEEDTEEDPTLECCRPLRIEVWSIPEKVLVDGNWKTPERLGELYKGQHGMKAQTKELKTRK